MLFFVYDALLDAAFQVQSETICRWLAATVQHMTCIVRLDA